MKKIIKCFLLLFLLTSSISLAYTSDVKESENFLAVPGGRIWYKVFYSEKSKNKIPLLALHGGPGVPHDYLEVLKNLAVNRPVIFYDQLGCGHSKVPLANKKLWNTKRYVTELETLVDHLKLNKINLFGHSWGGTLAVEYAIIHPERINTLTLASPFLSSKLWISDSNKLISKLPLKIQKIIATHEKQGTTNSIEYKNAVDIYYQHFVFNMKNWPIQLKYSAENISYDVYNTMWGPSEFTLTGNLKNYDRINDIQRLKIPILLTCGRHDEATPQTLEKIVHLLQNGKLIVYKKSAHFAFLNEEKDYLNNLEHFLRSNTRYD